MSIRSKTCTLAWFARRPSHWAHAVAHASRQVRSDLDGAEFRDAATEWARQNATSEESTIRWLGYKGEDILGFDDIVGHERFDAAQERVSSCPVEMGGAGDLRLLFYACEAVGATRVVETGVAYGWSSFAILSSLSGRDGGFLTSVDMSYPMRGGEDWVGAAVPEDLFPRWRVIDRPDRHGLSRALRQHGAGVDLCHYDSDKTYYGRRWAYPKLWKALGMVGYSYRMTSRTTLRFGTS